MVDIETINKYHGYFKPSEFRKNDIHSFNFNEQFYKELKVIIKNLSDIVISGGEPFLSDNFYFFIEWLVKNSYSEKLNLNVFTNGMKMPKNYRLYNDKFRSFNIRISIDGIGKKDEYIRTGTIFDKKVENINLLHRYFKVDFFTTVSMLNVGYMNEIKRFCSQYTNVSLHYNQLIEPFFLQVINIPNIIKNKYIDKNENHKLLHVEGDFNYFKLGMLYLKKFDQINNTFLLNEWPEFNDFY